MRQPNARGGAAMNKRAFLAGLALAVAAGIGTLFWLGHREHDVAPVSSIVRPDESIQLVERGRYLARLGNCMGCHTEPGGAPYAGGRALPTPFGTFYGPNLTPDPEHGLGRWSAEDFWRALHHGKAPDGRLLYPAFPYPSYRYV